MALDQIGAIGRNWRVSPEVETFSCGIVRRLRFTLVCFGFALGWVGFALGLRWFALAVQLDALKCTVCFGLG